MVSDLYGHLAFSNRDFDLYGEPYKSETTVGYFKGLFLRRRRKKRYFKGDLENMISEFGA